MCPILLLTHECDERTPAQGQRSIIKQRRGERRLSVKVSTYIGNFAYASPPCQLEGVIDYPAIEEWIGTVLSYLLN